MNQNTEIIQNTERPFHKVESDVPETISNQVPTTTEQVETDNSQASGTAQIIQQERQRKPSSELDNKHLGSELSYIATLQREKLGDEQPSAGFGSKNLPFAN